VPARGDRGLDFTQGWIFGLPVSRDHGGIGLLTGRLTGPELLTGGAFGLEASLRAVVVATTAGVAILAVPVRKGSLVPPMRVRKPVSAPVGAPPVEQSHTSPM
jgi:hypothetical protein